MTVVTLGLLLYIGLHALICCLVARSRKRNWLGAVIRTGVIILSVIISVIISRVIVSTLGDQLYSTLGSMLGDDIADLANTMPVAAAGIVSLIGAIVAPIIFVFIFLIIRLILTFIAKIPEKILGKTLPEKVVKIPCLKGAIGAINGVLIACVTLLPLCGFLTVASKAMSALELPDDDKYAETTVDSTEVSTAPTTEFVTELVGSATEYVTDFTTERESTLSSSNVTSAGYAEQTKPVNSFETSANGSSSTSSDSGLEDIIDMVVNDPVVKFVDFLGHPAFRALTSDTIEADNGDKIKFVLEDEIINLAKVAAHGSAFLEDMEANTIDNSSKEHLKQVSNSLFSSDWVGYLVTDAVSSASASWADGESFAGMKRPETPAVFDPTFQTMLDIFATLDRKNVKADFDTIIDVLFYIAQADLLSDGADLDTIMKNLGEGAILSNIINTLEGNQHMAPLADSIKDLGMRVVATSIGKIEIGESAEYDQFIGTVASSLNDSLDMSKEERDEYVKEMIQVAFVDYDIEVPEDIALTFSDKLITDLGSDGEITEDELSNYLDQYVVTTESNDSNNIPGQLPGENQLPNDFGGFIMP